jgi:hypothetical protein
MNYSDEKEMIAALILDERRHACGPKCLCFELRAIPAIQEAIQKLEAQITEGS